MKIGQLAQRAGVGIDTVRYYEREGLLPRAWRLESGNRAYEELDVKRLRFVRRANSRCRKRVLLAARRKLIAA